MPAKPVAKMYLVKDKVSSSHYIVEGEEWLDAKGGFAIVLVGDVTMNKHRDLWHRVDYVAYWAFTSDNYSWEEIEKVEPEKSELPDGYRKVKP